MTKDYTYTYPEGFFDLFGAISDESFVVPEDLLAEDTHEFEHVDGLLVLDPLLKKC